VILTNFGWISGNLGIFSSPLDAKLGANGLVLQWNGHSKAFWTLTFELVGRNTATLYFRTDTVAGTTFRASWFWSTSPRFPKTWGIFSSLGDSKLTFDRFGLQWNAHSKTFWTLMFELLDRNIAPLHFKTERVAETALEASWFWPASARFTGTWVIFSSPRDAKLTRDDLVFQSNNTAKRFERSLSGLWAEI